MRRSSSARRSGCPISVALELFGDPWSLLIIRDLKFRRLNTFDAFLSAGEGIATNTLSDRLARLRRAGIIYRQRSRLDGRRGVYRLTPKGNALTPLLVEVARWAKTHEVTDAPPAGILALIERRRTIIGTPPEGRPARG